MRVLVAGHTGVIGRQLVPLLTATGHEVIGLSRSEGVDALDRDAVFAAVEKAQPDAVVHLLTAIPADFHPRRIEKDFALTNRLRTEGTRNLIDAAHTAGATRIIAQSVAFAYEPADGLANEDAPLWRDVPASFASSIAALQKLEQLTGEAGGLVLRFGHLYGPGTAYAPDSSVIQAIRAGRMPIVGKGTAMFSFTHTHDAATAIVSVLARPALIGALNVVDDDPALVRDWLPVLARILQAPVPKRVPKFLARLVAGAWGVAFLTELRGADNARARLELNWRPRYTSWREGFRVEH